MITRYGENLMRPIVRLLAGSALLLSLLSASACKNSTKGAIQASGAEQNSAQQPAPQQPAPPEMTTLTIPAGTELRVRLVDGLGSDRSRRGESFLATLDEPVIVDGWVAVPKGTNVTGRVVAAQASGHLRHPAQLSLTLGAIQLGGQNVQIDTSYYTRRGRSHAKRNAGWIGGLAGGGALLGALIGHGKGAAIGAGIGAGAGAGTAYATGKKDIYLPPETLLRFTLRQPVTLSRSA